MLFVSNIFMTFAWYGHLKYKSKPLWLAILASWLLAFFEYCFQVPANHWGHGRYSAVELKTMQEALTLFVFVLFSSYFLREPLRWNHGVGFLLMVAAVFVVFHRW